MTGPVPAQPDENMQGVLQRLHQLGIATEALFNRVYGGLTKRQQLAEQQEKISSLAKQVVETENRLEEVHQLAQQQRVDATRMKVVLDKSSEGVIMRDEQGRITYVNESAQQLIGSMRNFWQSELGILFNQRGQLAATTGELVPLGDAQQVQVNNRVLSAQIMAVSQDDQERIGTIMILRDVTEQTLAQRMQSSFLTHISHELKTPITSASYANDFLMNLPEDMPANRRMLEKVGNNIDILARLLDDMLEMSILNSGNFILKKDTLPLVDTINNIITSFHQQIEQRNLEVSIWIKEGDALQQYYGDPKYVSLALSHLIRNAIIYNENDQEIIVTARLIENTHTVEISVMDTGVGIAEEDLPHIFDLYYRGKPMGRDGKRLDPRGLGQGLHMVRRILQEHGGSIQVQSRPGEGSTFTLMLPYETGNQLPE